MRVPGLADPRSLSLQPHGDPDAYVRHDDGRLTVGRVPTAADRLRATFVPS
ncbi:AbfB domain-containing protein [Amycolatopsis suaedae]|uniref:AbfB domain-containing protein n=1 Tax=Amycolatopsis suaedae TaxID=2510978 RepID=UPI001F105B9A|nr:AbfB domain-containing protein [Amycolatopsis suaedae]